MLQFEQKLLIEEEITVPSVANRQFQNMQVMKNANVSNFWHIFYHVLAL